MSAKVSENCQNSFNLERVGTYAVARVHLVEVRRADRVDAPWLFTHAVGPAFGSQFCQWKITLMNY